MKMKILLVLGFIILYVFSAITHEMDLSRNFEKYGDAKAWFFPIKK